MISRLWAWASRRCSPPTCSPCRQASRKRRACAGRGGGVFLVSPRARGGAIPSAPLVAAMQEGDVAAAIAQFAGHGEPAACMALELFISIYGAFTGNLALRALPRGGIFIAGGIAAKIADKMRGGDF